MMIAATHQISTEKSELLEVVVKFALFSRKGQLSADLLWSITIQGGCRRLKNHSCFFSCSSREEPLARVIRAKTDEAIRGRARTQHGPARCLRRRARSKIPCTFFRIVRVINEDFGHTHTESTRARMLTNEFSGMSSKISKWWCERARMTFMNILLGLG